MRRCSGGWEGDGVHEWRGSVMVVVVEVVWSEVLLRGGSVGEVSGGGVLARTGRHSPAYRTVAAVCRAAYSTHA